MTRIYKENGTYWMDDNGVITELKNIKADKKRPQTGDYIVLPKNSANNQFCKCHYVDETGEYILKDKLPADQRKTSTPKASKAQGISIEALMEHLPEEVKAQIREAEEKAKRVAMVHQKRAERERLEKMIEDLDREIEALENPKTEENTEVEA
jgi:hypothetical protein